MSSRKVAFAVTSPIAELLIRDGESIAASVTRLDASPLGLLFVVDGDGRLVGRLAGDDIERALARGLSRVADAMAPVADAGPGTVVPLIDADRRPTGFQSPASKRRVPIAEPKLGGNELKYVTECIETAWISSQGPFVRRFETEFAARLGVPHALAVSNGTVALHLALAAYGLAPGDEVIVPDLTFAATLNAVIYTGATPVLVDVAPDTWNMDPEAVAAAITPRTKAIMPVHLYGQPADMGPILALARRRGLIVVEDAAEAAGSSWKGTPCGAIGDCGTFSFFSNKLITTGEGGMVVFKDDAIAARARRLRDHGMNPAKRYWHDEVGFNYRLTNLQAAIGCAQLEQMDGFLARKKAIASFYSERFAAIPEIETPRSLPEFENSYWVFSIVVDCASLGLTRDEFMARLAAAGVDTRPLFYCMHDMPPYKPFSGNRAFPVASRLSAGGLSLPSSAAISDAELDYVAATVERVIGARRLVQKHAA
jgi:perosamine synthetase